MRISGHERNTAWRALNYLPIASPALVPRPLDHEHLSAVRVPPPNLHRNARPLLPPRVHRGLPCAVATHHDLRRLVADLVSDRGASHVPSMVEAGPAWRREPGHASAAGNNVRRRRSRAGVG